MSDIVVDYGSSRPQDGQASWQDWQQAAPAPVTAPAFASQPPAPPAPPVAPTVEPTFAPAASTPPTMPSAPPAAPAAPQAPVAAVTPEPAAAAEDSGFVTSRHTGGNASFARFVPDSTELDNRTASLKPAATAVLERDDDAAYEWGTTSEEQLAGAADVPDEPATGSATPRGKRPTGRIAAAVLAIAAAVVAVGMTTGAFGLGGPQQTAQTPVTPTTLVSEATPLAPDASIAQSGELAQGGLGDYPAATPTEAMVAVLGAVQGQDALLLRSVTSPTADIAAVTDIAAQIDARSAAIDSARNGVECTTAGTTATCDVPPMALGRRVAFAQGPAGWSLTGWGS